MRINVYCWFEKVGVGVYSLSLAGEKGVADWSNLKK
jgi:hypothetical protein